MNHLFQNTHKANQQLIEIVDLVDAGSNIVKNFECSGLLGKTTGLPGNAIVHIFIEIDQLTAQAIQIPGHATKHTHARHG